MAHAGNHSTDPDGLLLAMRGIEAFVFDFDGTLADTESIHYLAYKTVLESLGVAFSVDEFRTYIGQERTPVYRAIKDRHGLSFDDEGFFRLKTEAFLALACEHDLQCFGYYRQLRSGFPEKPAYIVSSQDDEVIVQQLRRWGMEHEFVGMLTTREHEPKKQIIEGLAKEPGLKLALTAYFEDSPANLSMGKELGLVTVGIQTRLNGVVLGKAAYSLDVRAECYDLPTLLSAL